MSISEVRYQLDRQLVDASGQELVSPQFNLKITTWTDDVLQGEVIIPAQSAIYLTEIYKELVNRIEAIIKAENPMLYILNQIQKRD